MRDPKRIDEITNLLNEIWHKYPDLRFWQLMDLLRGTMYNKMAVRDLFYCEDDVTKKFFKDIETKERI